MTMRVIVINDDTEPSRELSVSTMEVRIDGGPIAVMNHDTIHAGKHKEFWVHSTAMLEIREKDIPEPSSDMLEKK